LKRDNVIHRDGGVYLQTMGPRFETKAEIRFMASMGDVVGMTGLLSSSFSLLQCLYWLKRVLVSCLCVIGADEATLFKEGGIGYAAICMIDNFANGVQPAKELEFSDFAEGVKRNMAIVESIARWVINEV